jgi:NADPH-dependent curcumin reductase CurA
MPERNRRLVLAERPRGEVEEKTIRLEQADVPELQPGQALVRNRYLSIDPTIRTWMDDVQGYLPPIGIGEVVRGAGIGEVVGSNCDRYQAGDLVFGMVGWQDYALADDGERSAQVLPAGVEPTAALSVFGVTGMTAYFGLIDVGKVQEGDTVVVSGAAGATGSIVGQVARIKGAGRVVGIAGSDAKCAWLVDELGFDDAVNYRTENVAARLREACPDGIDLYFDNVGGELLDICLAQLALRGRVVLCGAIASYNDRGAAVGPRNYRNLIPRRGRMEGFLILDYMSRFAEGQAEMAQWVAEGKVKFAVHLVEGLERAPEALNLLFTGGNTGKVIVKVD